MAAAAVEDGSARLAVHRFREWNFAHLQLPKIVPSTVTPRKILIVDVSGSMGSHAPRLVHTVLPSVLKPEEPVEAILFSDHQTYLTTTAEQLRDVRFQQGSTYMGAIPHNVGQAIVKHQAVQVKNQRAIIVVEAIEESVVG